MTSTGTFKLLNNTGELDTLLNSSELLSNRLKEIKEEKKKEFIEEDQIKLITIKNGLKTNLYNINKIRSDIGYTINEIRAIDPLYVPNREFDTERIRELYNKLTKNENWRYLIEQRMLLIENESGTNKAIEKKLDMNDKIQPTLNDICKTHVNFLTKSFKPFVAIGYEYTSDDPIGNNYQFDQMYKYKIRNIGSFTHDQFIHVRLEGLKSINPNDKVRYCDLLGHRIFESIVIKSSGSILDQYTTERYNNYFNFELLSHKRDGWLRNMGHGLPKYGYMTSDPSFQFSEVRYIMDGPQTLKTSHDVVDIFVPLLFWYNLDVGLSLPNQIIPNNQLELEIKVVDVNKICAYDNASGLNAGFVKPRITIARMYSNHIHINPEINDMLLTKINFTLIRVHRQLQKILDKPEEEIQLLDLKWPLERMYFTFKPTENELGPNNMDLWHRNGKMTVNEIPTAGITVAPFASAVSFIRHYNEQKSVDELSLTAHGVKLYDAYPSQIFNSYMPYKFGKLTTPESEGYYMINFDLTPGEYQPSGHFNVSRAREFFIRYRSKFINMELPTYLQLTGICINFLVVKDGHAFIKFTT